MGDIVPAITRISEEKSAYGNAYNLGGSYEISILTLAQRIVELLGSESPITLVPYEQAYAEGYEDMRRRVPNNSKAKDLVGFDPKTTLDQIIQNVAADHRPVKAPDPLGWKVTMAAN